MTNKIFKLSVCKLLLSITQRNEMMLCSITMKHITAAMDRLQERGATECNSQSSLLERVLALEPDNPRLACILALDMFLVGIDTVSSVSSSYQILKKLDQTKIWTNNVVNTNFQETSQNSNFIHFWFVIALFIWLKAKLLERGV